SLPNYYEDEIDESVEDTTPIIDNGQNERRNRDSSVENDFAIAMQLQQILNEETLEENEETPSRNNIEFENYETNSDTEVRRNDAIKPNRKYIESLNDEDDDDLDQVTIKVSSVEITSNDLKTVITQFKNKLFEKNPTAPRRIIKLSSRNQLLMFSEFIEAIKRFRDVDFIQRPKIEFQHEPVADYGGAFNDT
ncbi:3639_t:CDS:2, partial [Gigaspora rosea]